jgi:hypothetical protein
MWHYRPCRKFNVVDGKRAYYWCIVEYYTWQKDRGDNGAKEHAWSSSPEAPIADSKKELIATLKMMLRDIKHYPSIYEKRETRC